MEWSSCTALRLEITERRKTGLWFKTLHSSIYLAKCGSDTMKICSLAIEACHGKWFEREREREGGGGEGSKGLNLSYFTSAVQYLERLTINGFAVGWD